MKLPSGGGGSGPRSRDGLVILKGEANITIRAFPRELMTSCAFLAFLVEHVRASWPFGSCRAPACQVGMGGPWWPACRQPSIASADAAGHPHQGVRPSRRAKGRPSSARIGALTRGAPTIIITATEGSSSSGEAVEIAVAAGGETRSGWVHPPTYAGAPVMLEMGVGVAARRHGDDGRAEIAAGPVVTRQIDVVGHGTPSMFEPVACRAGWAFADAVDDRALLGQAGLPC